LFSQKPETSYYKKELTGLINGDNNLEPEHKQFLLKVVEKSNIAKFELPQEESWFGFKGGISKSNRTEILSAISKTQYIDPPELFITFAGNSAFRMRLIDSYLTKELSNSLQNILQKMQVHVRDRCSLDQTKEILDCSQTVVKALKSGEEFQTEKLESILAISGIDQTSVQEDKGQILKLVEVYGTIFVKVVISQGTKKGEQEHMQMNKMVVEKFLFDLILDLKTVILKAEDNKRALQEINELKKQLENDYQSLMRKQELKYQKDIEDLKKQKQEQERRYEEIMAK